MTKGMTENLVVGWTVRTPASPQVSFSGRLEALVTGLTTAAPAPSLSDPSEGLVSGVGL